MRLIENPEQTLGPTHRVELPAGALEYHDVGRGRPLVFAHGIAVGAALWRKVVPALASDYRCVVPRLPLGAHTLPMNPEADLSPTGVADLLADFLDALDLRDAVVVGNDTGGAYTQILLTRHPERVGAAVLTSCDAFGHFLPWQFWHLQLAARLPGSVWLTAQLLRSARLRRSALGYGLLTKHGVDDVVLASYVAAVRRDARVRRDLTKVLRGIRTRYTREAARLLPEFDKAVLLAWSAHDPVFPLRDAERLAELLPDARLEPVHDSYCYVPEDQPERLVALIDNFLAGTTAADAPPGNR